MFLGWEAVGLASYLLINFWSTRNQANQSALKAIIFNRFGDIFFISALAMLWSMFNSFDFTDIEILIPQFKQLNITLFSLSFPMIELLALFLFLAAAAKSAQLFLHPWLPDAMEGPTPVSALLHSATMVTAGVFLILRSSLIFTNAPQISFFVACIGLITANISAVTGLLQYDIKRIIAFSTCSQLGFMIFATGIGNFSFALFHLINHAFFKALLFLCAGSVIHATKEQDIRKMGALFKALPITYVTMLLASLSLVGFPFLSGFYSKDFLLESTYAMFNQFAYVIYFISAVSTAVSSFYSFRLIYFVFFGETALPKRYLLNVAEGSYFLYFPLILLAFFSIFSGFYLKDLLLVYSSFYFFNTSPLSDITLDLDFFNDLFKILPTIFSIFGLVLVYVGYYKLKVAYSLFYKRYIVIAYLFCKKFFSDAFNSFYIFIPTATFSLNITYKLLDQGIYEFSSPLNSLIESVVSRLQNIETTAFIYRSLLFVIFSIIFLVTSVLSQLTLTLILLTFSFQLNDY
jgi:proton-translocating NADH-quinone oxidoreductase chain L